MRSPTASTTRATGGRGVRYAWRPRRTLCSHDCQRASRRRASRRLSVNAVALYALCPPLYCPGATRPRQACSQSSYLMLSGCQLQGGPSVRLARHRRRKQALRRQRYTARRIGGCDKHCDTTTMHSPTAFHTDAAKKFTVQRQMNRARGGSVIRRSKGTEHCDYVVTRVRIYRFFCALLALKLSLARSYRWRAASTPSK